MRVAEPLGGSEGEENGNLPITETSEEPVKKMKKDDYSFVPSQSLQVL